MFKILIDKPLSDPNHASQNLWWARRLEHRFMVKATPDSRFHVLRLKRLTRPIHCLAPFLAQGRWSLPEHPASQPERRIVGPLDESRAVVGLM